MEIKEDIIYLAADLGKVRNVHASAIAAAAAVDDVKVCEELTQFREAHQNLKFKSVAV